jgi:hypothetical protein
MSAREAAERHLGVRRKGQTPGDVTRASGLRGIGYALLVLAEAVVAASHKFPALTVDPHPGVPEADGDVLRDGIKELRSAYIRAYGRAGGGVADAPIALGTVINDLSSLIGVEEAGWSGDV